MIFASCHCGAVRIEIAEPPSSVTDCNCSICRRRGALWAYYRPAQVRFLSPPDATAVYSWGDKDIAFHHCKVCGCTTHWSGLVTPPVDRMGVNARLTEPSVLDGLPVRKFDGASL